MRNIALSAQMLPLSIALRRHFKKRGLRIKFPNGRVRNFGQKHFIGPTMPFDSWRDIWAIVLNQLDDLADAYTAGRIHHYNDHDWFRCFLDVLLDNHPPLESCLTYDHWWHLRNSFVDGQLVMDLDADQVTHLTDIRLREQIQRHLRYRQRITDNWGAEFWRRRYFWLMLTEVALFHGHITPAQLIRPTQWDGPALVRSGMQTTV